MVFEVRVAQNGDSGPMMEGVVEGLRASSAHEDLPALATLFGNWGDPAMASKGAEVSKPNGIVSVAEKGSKNESPDARQGGEDGGIGRMVGIGIPLNLGEPPLEILIDVAALATNESQLWDQQSEMSDEGLEAAGSELEVLLLKDMKDVIGLDPADVMFADEDPDVVGSGAGTRIEAHLEELAEEGIQGTIARSQAQKVGSALNQQVLNLRAEGDVQLDELNAGAEELAQGDDLWRRKLQALESMPIGS